MPDLALEREAIALFERLLDIDEGERAAWIVARTGGRSALRARLAAMLAAHESAGMHTGMATDDLDEEAPPERIGAYRIVERIGRGGMGSVYLGERMTGDFAHRAAIKIIKPGLLSDSLAERFRRERQLLATLSHPNIAQLYDGGETESGSPYFVMEYVDGLPLLDWVALHDPPHAGRLRLFSDICAAVSFAHRNLIVHRDLTPSNVLVTRDGVVKLIDFGIARPADEIGEQRDSSRPSLASLSLTPGYAAPERMTSSAVTTASDIYSLGKLLETLLPPGQGGREPAAILARATATDPLDRYPTAEALGADIAAWRDGFPVAAMGGGRRYAASRFVGRHRLAVAAAAAALVLLVGALTLTLFANARAERALADSEHRFAETRAIAKALLFDAYDEVSRAPASTRARALLARTGLTYLEALAADSGAPLDVRIETGLGYLRLAQVTGGGQASQLGRYQDSNALLARAEEMLAPLERLHPGDPGVRRAMAALLVEQSATNLYNNNATDRAREQARRAQALLRADAASSIENARLYALALQGEGDSFLWADAFADARRVHLAAEAFIAGLAPALRDHPQVLAVRSANLRLLGEAYHKLHADADAHRVLDQAVTINRALVAGRPDDPALRRKLVVSLRYRAIVLRTDGDNEGARASIEEARNAARLLRDRDASDTGAAQLYAVVSEVDAQILADLRRYPESYAVGEDVLATHRRLVALAGNTPGALRSMAQSLRTHGGNRYNGGDFAGACASWREAMTIFEGLERGGSLTAGDRNGAVTELRDLLRRACNPPRGGVALTI